MHTITVMYYIKITIIAMVYMFSICSLYITEHQQTHLNIQNTSTSNVQTARYVLVGYNILLCIQVDEQHAYTL